LLLSATFGKRVERVARGWLNDPVRLVFCICFGHCVVFLMCELWFSVVCGMIGTAYCLLPDFFIYRVSQLVALLLLFVSFVHLFKSPSELQSDAPERLQST
jgi:hypothetical protein